MKNLQFYILKVFLAILFSSQDEVAEMYRLFPFIVCLSFICLSICCRKGYFASRGGGGRLVQISLGYKFKLLKCLQDEPWL